MQINPETKSILQVSCEYAYSTPNKSDSNFLQQLTKFNIYWDFPVSKI